MKAPRFPKLEVFMSLVAYEVHQTRRRDHFQVRGDEGVLEISVPEKETVPDGVPICRPMVKRRFTVDPLSALGLEVQTSDS
jgi:hypothetical protein